MIRIPNSFSAGYRNWKSQNR